MDKFWYSEQHEKHGRQIDLDNDEPTYSTSVLIDGKRRTYTAASGVDRVVEPWPGALKRFPDFRLLGIGDISTFQEKKVRREDQSTARPARNPSPMG